MERPNAWKKYDEAALAELDDLCERYRAFISDNKTERECVTSSIKLAEAAGYTNLADAVEQGRELKAGDKVRFVKVSVEFAQYTLLAQRAALRALEAINS